MKGIIIFLILISPIIYFLILLMPLLFIPNAFAIKTNRKESYTILGFLKTSKFV